MNKFLLSNTFSSRAEKYLSPCAVSDQTNISKFAKGIVYENLISVPLQTTLAKITYITFLKSLFWNQLVGLLWIPLLSLDKMGITHLKFYPIKMVFSQGKISCVLFPLGPILKILIDIFTASKLQIWITHFDQIFHNSNILTEPVW